MNQARLGRPRLVFPEGTHPRVLRAAQILVDEGICVPVLLGEAWKVYQRAEQNGINLHGVEIAEIHDDDQLERYSQALWKARQRRGLTYSAARAQCRNATTYGLMMVREGDAGGFLGGLATPYHATLRPALQTLGPAEGVKVISAVYAMLFGHRRIYLGDCTVNRDPDPETLAQIAINTAEVARTFGDTPRVAMLAYSDFGEIRGAPEVEKVARAVEIVQRLRPDIVIDGEMQADTAVSPAKAAADFPFSRIQGDANVLIFPALNSGNITYKLLRDLGGATAIGPILHGLRAPVNVLALGATVADIVNMAAITVKQGMDAGRIRVQP
jgi:malate dehydrogenase (oxaloacetate-decarboxylating)(NADP+)